DDRGHDALADLALLQRVEEGLADLALRLLQPGAAGQDHVVAVLVQLDDLGLELAADVRLQVADAAHLDQRRGQEAAQADVQDEPALDDLDDRTGDDAVLVLEDRKSTRLNSSHVKISYAVFCLKKKKASAVT